MLTRRLAVTLLAPTVLVSLALVVACLFGVTYLNRLHLDVADDLNENHDSRQAAESLRVALGDLLGLVKGAPPAPSADQDRRIFDKMRQSRELLATAERLANREEERRLVRTIADGLDQLQAAWTRRASLAAEASVLSARDAQIIATFERDLLAPSTELYEFNTQMESRSVDQNKAIVQTLRWVLLLAGVGAPVGGLLLGYGLARAMHRSITQLSVRIRDVAGRLNRDLGSVTLREEGDLPGLHLQFQRVTEEIERVVQQLQQREREVLHAEQLAAVGQVAAGVAHELRNPLTSVKMLVQSGLEGEKPTGLPPDDLTIIERELRRMEACIQTFLDFARPPRAERRRTDLLAVIRRAVALTEGRARRQQVEIVTDLPAAPLLVEIDSEQVQQVLVNLVLNALDALPHGGRIRLAVAAAGSGVEVQIQDTGTGIPEAIRPRLFEPFVSSKETGLGLGLSISKRLIEAHGGTISGTNATAGGALFSFRLPGDGIGRESPEKAAKVLAKVE